MQLSGNTILITGGGTGIGRALAEQFHARGNTVILAGRRLDKLQEVAAAHSGMHARALDIADPQNIRSFAENLKRDFPALNAVVHNAGIMANERFRDATLDVAEATIATNLLGPIRLNAALLPHLLAQPRAAVLTVSSGIAFVPLAGNPSYGATKAAIHSWTQALRYQLQDTGVQVIELIPPYVQTELQGPAQAADPNALPLADYIAQTMAILESTPDATEVIIERVQAQRYAEARGEYDSFFKTINDRARSRWE